jgi:hypothetical protein
MKQRERDFHVNGFNKNGTRKYQWACKTCWKKIASKRSKAHYHANKEYYRERNKRHKLELMAFIRALKDNKRCTDCQKKFRYYVLQFDHVRGVKSYDVSRMRSLNSKKAVLNEVAKCDLVCANCHAERTFKRSNTTRTPNHKESSPTNQQVVARSTSSRGARGARVSSP